MTENGEEPGNYYCEKHDRGLIKPCCPDPDEKCKYRSDCPVYFEMMETRPKECNEETEKGDQETK